MGRSSTFRCATCKKLYYLGYAPYCAWLDYVDTEDEFHAKAEEAEVSKPREHDRRDLSCNQNILKCLNEHKGHDFTFVNEDWSCTDWMDNPPEGWEDFPEDFERIDFEESTK